MSCYIDPITEYTMNRLNEKNARKRVTGRWCHMIADDHEELLAMAKKIGLNLVWIQGLGKRNEHFDLSPTKRELARRAGAQEVTSRLLVEIMARKAEYGAAPAVDIASPA